MEVIFEFKTEGISAELFQDIEMCIFYLFL